MSTLRLRPPPPWSKVPNILWRGRVLSEAAGGPGDPGRIIYRAPGKGAQAQIEGRAVLLGNRRLMLENEISFDSEDMSDPWNRRARQWSMCRRWRGCRVIARRCAENTAATWRNCGDAVTAVMSPETTRHRGGHRPAAVLTGFSPRCCPGTRLARKRLQEQGERVIMVGDGITTPRL